MGLTGQKKMATFRDGGLAERRDHLPSSLPLFLFLGPLFSSRQRKGSSSHCQVIGLFVLEQFSVVIGAVKDRDL